MFKRYAWIVVLFAFLISGLLVLLNTDSVSTDQDVTTRIELGADWVSEVRNEPKPLNGVILVVTEVRESNEVKVQIKIQNGEGHFLLLSNGPEEASLQWTCSGFGGSECTDNEGTGGSGPEGIAIHLVASTTPKNGVTVVFSGDDMYQKVWAFGVYDTEKSGTINYPYVSLCGMKDDEFVNFFNEQCNVSPKDWSNTA